MKIAIGADHAGFAYKEPIIHYLQDHGYDVIDVGTDSTVSTDYPTYAFKVGETVATKTADLGILICGTGIGMSIAANKVTGIRAAAIQSTFAAQATKEHNHANVLCVGTRTNTLDEVLSFVSLFLETAYSNGERHSKRIQMISEYEKEKH